MHGTDAPYHRAAPVLNYNILHLLQYKHTHIQDNVRMYTNVLTRNHLKLWPHTLVAEGLIRSSLRLCPDEKPLKLAHG